MTTDSLEDAYERPSVYDISEVDKDPFAKKKDKSRIGILRIAVILAVVALVIVPQLMKLDQVSMEGKPLVAAACAINFFCHDEQQDNASVCVCPPMIAKVNT
jgi:hypothetical protein